MTVQRARGRVTLRGPALVAFARDITAAADYRPKARRRLQRR